MLDQRQLLALVVRRSETKVELGRRDAPDDIAHGGRPDVETGNPMTHRVDPGSSIASITLLYHFCHEYPAPATA